MDDFDKTYKLVYSAFSTFASSQGSYGRMLEMLEETDWDDIDTREAFLNQFGKCKSIMDVIFAVECGC